MSYEQLNFDPIPKRVESIYTDRLNLFLQLGQYKDRSLPKFYERDRVHDDYVKLEVWSAPGIERPKFAEAVKQQFRPATKGEKFGPSWTTHWFRVSVLVPEEWKKANRVILNWNCENEGLVFTEDGKVVVGLSGEERREWVLPDAWNDREWHTFYIETSCNGMFGNADPHDNIQPPIPDRFFHLVDADLVWPNDTARALRMDFSVIADCAKNMPEDSWQKKRALKVANDIINEFDADDVSSLNRCRRLARSFLGDNVDSAKVYESGAGASEILAVGHCHIDTAWLWPYAETRRKIGRSWSTQLDLIERYPEYNFVCSQAVQYQWLKEDYPELFERLKAQVKAGRFMPIGGSWVECDTNMPSGEAVARQFLYGQRFFEANFGARCTTFWLPDTFGYSAQIPQLCRLAGMSRFLTQKLSWNNINRFPHTTFNWIAPDGSQVLCHMPPADTYNSNGSVSELRMSTTNNKSRDVSEKSLLLFGYGDGGGGPTPEMLERLRRARGVADTVGELPRVGMPANVDDYFDQVQQQTRDGKDLATWVGELYFEFHRGTYTTQSNTKKGNRRGEALLHDLEYLCALLSVANSDYKYPKDTFDRMWGLVLLNQFHDVLPGSSIELVYEDVAEIIANVNKLGAAVLSDAFNALAGGTAAAEAAVFNPLPWPRAEIVSSGANMTGEQPALGDSSLRLVTVPGPGVFDVAAASAQEQTPATAKQTADGVFVLDNGALRATITHGHLTSLVDLVNDREIIDAGQRQRFVVFDDQPLNWQGWDTEVYSLDKIKGLPHGTARIVSEGPLRAAILVEQPISKDSWLKATISLDAVVPGSSAPGLSYLEYNCEVEWREACKFLKVEFPVDVNSDFATYDSMYGCVRRPTHYNTSWDVAKFEVCCHKYADYSDHTYGVSVLNDSKYGFSVHGRVMRLSLLRAAKAPDGNADMGRHNIRFAILGHKGGVSGDVVRTAYNFNHPLASQPVAGLSSLPTLRWDGPDNVILAAVKRAEDDADASNCDLAPKRKTKSLIVRLYDSLGGKASGRLITDLPVKRACTTNLLEDDLAELSVQQSNGHTAVPLALRAHEIISVRLEL